MVVGHDMRPSSPGMAAAFAEGVAGAGADVTVIGLASTSPAYSLAAILGALVALTGCPPTYPKCENDEHCKEHNEVCVQGTCAECATDAPGRGVDSRSA